MNVTEFMHNWALTDDIVDDINAKGGNIVQEQILHIQEQRKNKLDTEIITHNICNIDNFIL